jgi:hypothetical protein
MMKNMYLFGSGKQRKFRGWQRAGPSRVTESYEIADSAWVANQHHNFGVEDSRCLSFFVVTMALLVHLLQFSVSLLTCHYLSTEKAQSFHDLLTATSYAFKNPPPY